MPTRPDGRTAVRLGALVGWVVVLAGTLVVLLRAGGELPGPPLGSPSRWSGWAVGRDPVVAAFGVVRLGALAAAWYALGITLLGAVVRLLSAARAAAALDRLTVPPLRGVLAATLGLGMVSMVSTPVTASARVGTTVSTPAGSPVTAPPAADEPPGVPAPAGAPAEPPPSERPPAWTVQPGDCFWSIAEKVLLGRTGRAPAPAEIVPYWRRLIETNRAALADPANPDLVFPGQTFTLPDSAVADKS
jgi:hypothetical protein